MSKDTWSRLCVKWSKLVFKDKFGLLTPRVRTMRLLEEALELAQAEGVTGPEASIILNQVYDKPIGDPYKELGGVLITAATYAGVARFNLEEAFYDEFERIMNPEIM